MKIIKFLFSFAISLSLIIALNTKIGQIPPLGKFLDPVNGFWHNARQAYEPLPEILALEGLHHPVNIYFDEEMVPHLFASDNNDLFFAQAYVTAQDRLWQMEFQTHAASGRIAEIVGEQALDYDRNQRRIGLVLGAKNTLSEMEKDDEIASYLESYANGINTYINQLDYKNLPIEYKLLDYKPETWSPLKTALLLSYMGNSLSGSDKDFENTVLVKLLGEERFNILFPEYFEAIDPVISNDRKWEMEVKIPKKPEMIDYPYFSKEEDPYTPNPQNGSNNWAVSGAKTITGKPILVNDPHLGLNLPSLWYVMQLNSPDINTMGGTLPGALGVILGFNDSIAWGCTNATRDVKDWYHITFRDDSRTEYRFDDKWLKAQKHIEEIKIRNGDTFYDTIIHTHYGPVVYDKYFRASDSKANYALRWTLHDASSEQRTFIDINRSENYEDFTEALTYYKNPAQNFAFASSSGDIAMWINGKIPLRWEGQGKFVMDGSDSRYEWAGYIPQKHNPHELNPKRGFISSANQHPVGQAYPYWGYDANYEHFRNRRINEILRKSSDITVEDMMKLQNDNYNIMASESLDSMLAMLNHSSLSETEKKAYSILSDWNKWNNPNETGPVYYDVWWDQFYAMMWNGIVKKQRGSRIPEESITIHYLRSGQLETLIIPEDNSKSIATLAQESFSKAVAAIEDWRSGNEDQQLNWGNYKNTTAKHLALLDAFSVKGIAVGGNRHIINANSSTHGASWRYIVSFTNEGVEAYGIYPGGQSGNPGSPYYDNYIARWRDGQYMYLSFMDSPNDKRFTIKSKLELLPATQ